MVVVLCGTRKLCLWLLSCVKLESGVCGCYAVWNFKMMFVVVMLCGTGK